MKGYIRKGVAVLTVGVLMAEAVFPVPVSAADTNAGKEADAGKEANTDKEEVVYVNLGDDGTVEEINVVNIFTPNQGEQIVDYGSYRSVRNMTTTEEIDYQNDVVRIDTSSDKLYYEGKLEDTVMPWNIQIRYYLDGEEYSSEEIAGKDGELKITINISENKEYQGDFYDNYALQASLTLDTDKCSNILAEDATVANAGRNKQLTYTILPGEGADICVTADVSDFEMDGISINGIPLNLNIEVDDEELLEQVTELIDAVEELDDGALELRDGVSDLQDGVQDDLKTGVSDLKDGAKELRKGVFDLKDGGGSLKTGAKSLKSGAGELDEGLVSLNAGIGKMQKALNALNEQSPTLVNGSASFKKAIVQLQEALNGVSVSAEDLSALTDASSAIKKGIDDLEAGINALQENVSFEAYKAAMLKNGLDIDKLRQNNETAIGSLNSLTETLNVQIKSIKQSGADTSGLESQVTQMSEIIKLLDANNANILGTENYLETINENLSALKQGAASLKKSYAAFDGKIGELVDKLSGLVYKMSELSTAVNTLVSEYEKIDGGITDYTGAVAKIAASYSEITDGAEKLVGGSSELKKGSVSLYNGTDELVLGIADLYDGTKTLKDGTGDLDDGVDELITGIGELYDGTEELKDGTSEMRDETSGMDTEISDKIDELLDSVTGGDFETVSFVSEKNTNIDSVQFVIKTDGIKEPNIDEVVLYETQKLSAWQKFLNLFGR